MSSSDPVTLTRDVEAAIIPVGERVTLQKGQPAQITQTLGGSYTVIVNTGSGDGTLRLDLLANGTIVDDESTALAEGVPGAA